MRIATLGYLIQENQVLLAMKKRGFGKGWYNGFGGKVESNESFEGALIRECQEEIKVTPIEFEHMADLGYYDNDKLGFFVKMYFITKWHGEPKESDEMKPEWFQKEDIPYNKMWEDDKYWFPEVLKIQKLIGHFWFKDLFEDEKTMIKYEILPQ